MNRREAKRLALLLIVDDVERAIDIGEYSHDPEGEREFTVAERAKVVREARAVVDTLYTRARYLAVSASLSTTATRGGG